MTWAEKVKKYCFISELLDILCLWHYTRNQCQVDFKSAANEGSRFCFRLVCVALCAVMKVSDCFAACLIYWNKEWEANLLFSRWWCRARTRTRSKCAWWLSIIIRNYIIVAACWWQILPLRTNLIKFYDILTALGARTHYANENFTVIFYEQWEIENKIELCENCWTQKMRFLDRISVRFGRRKAKAISSINCRLE